MFTTPKTHSSYDGGAAIKKVQTIINNKVFYAAVWQMLSWWTPIWSHSTNNGRRATEVVPMYSLHKMWQLWPELVYTSRSYILEHCKHLENKQHAQLNKLHCNFLSWAETRLIWWHFVLWTSSTHLLFKKWQQFRGKEYQSSRSRHSIITAQSICVFPINQKS